MTHHGIYTIDATPLQTKPVSVSVEKLAKGVYTASAGSYRTLFLEADTSVVAVNTLPTPAAARALRDAIAATIPGKPITTLIQTIDHLDHTGYGADLAPNAEIIAHELTARLIAARNADGQLHPTRTITGTGDTLQLDGLTLTLLYPGPTVGTGNLALHLEQQRLLFLVGPQANARYGLFPDYHCEHYPTSLATLLQLDLDTLVPGRYPTLTRAEANRALSYFEALATAAQQAFANGVPIWELDAMQAHCSNALRQEWGHLDGFHDHVGLGALRLVHHYLMGGWGIEDTQQPELLLAQERVASPG